jgi:hypothetical protein
VCPQDIGFIPSPGTAIRTTFRRLKPWAVVPDAPAEEASSIEPRPISNLRQSNDCTERRGLVTVAKPRPEPL